jgi:hypothetical protein
MAENVHNINKEKPKNKEPLHSEPKQKIWAKPVEETKKVPLFKGNTIKQVIVSALLDEKTKSELINFVHDNILHRAQPRSKQESPSSQTKASQNV